MAKTQPFDEHLEAYEKWFERYREVYRSELEAVRRLLPLTAVDSVTEPAKGLEIGVGSGLFAAPLGIGYGVEPSARMREKAASRGIEVRPGVAEALPYEDGSFDFILMVTSICFIDDENKTMKEINRVLKPGGAAVLGFVDEHSPLGRVYQEHKEENVFYRDAVFFSAEKVTGCLEKHGFRLDEAGQTVYGMLDEIHEIQPLSPGYGSGGFVVIRAIRERN
ncbi:MAG: class I SAM-dependent methyltransferase [Spirochaetales bacterium]|nr:class I SAM-dependent methyltransferase [Spirochaetales bacterium]MCF7938531.1 class I SAM-dependent methyltransferase [Spirochaetales bacterium]